MLTYTGFCCKFSVPEEVDNTEDIRTSKLQTGMPENMTDYLQVLETGLSMMKAEKAEYISDIYQILKCLNKVQTKALTERQRREAGDVLANNDGAK